MGNNKKFIDTVKKINLNSSESIIGEVADEESLNKAVLAMSSAARVSTWFSHLASDNRQAFVDACKEQELDRLQSGEEITC